MGDRDVPTRPAVLKGEVVKAAAIAGSNAHPKPADVRSTAIPTPTVPSRHISPRCGARLREARLPRAGSRQNAANLLIRRR
jgi:hypothetical protein